MHAALNEERQRQLAALRSLVAEKFPQPAASHSERLLTGCSALDQHGGLLRGSVTEICGTAAGSQLVLSALLASATRIGFHLALIDGADAFEPADWPGEYLNRLLWVRCTETDHALKAADMLLRDGNLPILVLDLQVMPLRKLRRIPVSTWHRFQRVIEHSASSLLVFTPQPMIEGAPCRIATSIPSPWQAMQRPRSSLLENLDAQIFERGHTALRISA